MNHRIGVAAIGDVLDINCWSNIPWNFYTAGNRMGIFNEAWSVSLNRMEVLRYVWNVKQVLLGRGKGGFQYSATFLQKAEAQIPSSYFSSTVISFNQVFPRASSVVEAGGRIFYYIDSTLNDLFNERDYGLSIPAFMKERALDQEKKNYAAAAGVITMGSWPQESLIDFYQLPLYKIHKILPGANIELPQGFSHVPFEAGAGKDRDLILGFVGKDWKRKGLLILIEVKNELLRRGYRVRILAIGNYPEELKGAEGISFTGFIDKQQNPAEFISAISCCDIGCLLSSSEALGISTLEFLRTGVPVMGFFHQGLKDTLMEGASIRLAPQSTVFEIADRVEYYILHTEAFRAMKQKSTTISADVTWDKTIQQFRALL